MADLNRHAEEWARAHPSASTKEAFLAGYWTSTDNWCQQKR